MELPFRLRLTLTPEILTTHPGFTLVSDRDQPYPCTSPYQGTLIPKVGDFVLIDRTDPESIVYANNLELAFGKGPIIIATRNLPFNELRIRHAGNCRTRHYIASGFPISRGLNYLYQQLDGRLVCYANGSTGFVSTKDSVKHTSLFHQPLNTYSIRNTLTYTIYTSLDRARGLSYVLDVASDGGLYGSDTAVRVELCNIESFENQLRIKGLYVGECIREEERKEKLYVSKVQELFDVVSAIKEAITEGVLAEL